MAGRIELYRTDRPYRNRAAGWIPIPSSTTFGATSAGALFIAQPMGDTSSLDSAELSIGRTRPGGMYRGTQVDLRTTACRVGAGRAVSVRGIVCPMEGLLLFFVDGALGVGKNLIGDKLRNDVVMVHLHAVTALALGHGGEVGAVGEHLGHGHFGVDDRCFSP